MIPPRTASSLTIGCRGWLWGANHFRGPLCGDLRGPPRSIRRGFSLRSKFSLAKGLQIRLGPSSTLYSIEYDDLPGAIEVAIPAYQRSMPSTRCFVPRVRVNGAP